MIRIVLASSSPRRRELLARVGIRFAAVDTPAEMTPPPGMSADLAVQLIARHKAIVAASRYPDDCFIVGADTVVVGPHGVLGKPVTPERARQYLGELRGRRHTVLTGICVVATPAVAEVLGVSRSVVTMRDFSDIDMDRYIASGEPLDKAGGYAVQGGGGDLVESVSGRVDTVVGLDVPMVLKLLAEAGYPDPLPSATDIPLVPMRVVRRPLTPMRATQRA